MSEGELAGDSQPPRDDHRDTLTDSNVSGSVSTADEQAPVAAPSISGAEMLRRLRNNVQQLLTDKQAKALETFVKEMAKASTDDTALQRKAEEKVLRFKTTESKTSGHSHGGLISFSGNVSSKLGLLMHYPTHVKSNNEFFDEHNPCLQRFIRKGMNSDNCFGFDWHWRKEHSMGSGKCPRSQYEGKVIDLHDEMSAWLIRNLRLPLLCVVSECVWKGYKATFRTDRISTVRVQVAEGRNVEFMLHWNDALDRLDRIAFHCCHPDGMFRATGNEAALRACTIDSGLNLLFTVAKMPTNEEYFNRFNANRDQPIKDAKSSKISKYLPFPSIDPVKETHRIIREELTKQRIVPVSEINPLLLNWATAKYPDFDIEWRLRRGLSVAEAIRDEISAAISAGKQKKGAAVADKGPGTPLNKAGPSAKHVKHRWWNGKTITYTPSKAEGKEDRTWIKFHVLNESRDRFWTYEFTFQRSVDGKHHENLSGKVKIFFGERGIYLRRPTSEDSDGPIIWERAYSVLQRMADGHALVAHARKEYENSLKAE